VTKATENKEGKGETGATKEKVVRVRVICNGVLGKKLLSKGAVTDDPDYVALLGDPRNLVEEVK